MSDKSDQLDALIEVPMLQEEVKHLKATIARLERENAALMDRLSRRRPSSAVESEIKDFCRHCAKRLVPASPNRRTI